MKISKKTWHYRLIRSLKPDSATMPTNLCGYAGELLLLLFVGLPMLTVFMVALSPFILTEYLCELMKRCEANAPPKPPKRPGLLGAWITAKKQKICPLLEFED